MSRVNFDLSIVSRMAINFELLKVSKTTSLNIYISQVMEKLEHQIWTAGKPHSKGSVEALPKEVVTSLPQPRDFDKSLYL